MNVQELILNKSGWFILRNDGNVEIGMAKTHWDKLASFEVVEKKAVK
jgi:hypothetical protein